MQRVPKFIALAALLFSILACSLFTPSGAAPSPTSPATVPAATQAPADTATIAFPTQLATDTQAPTQPAAPASTSAPTQGKPEPTATAAASKPSADQLNACLNAFPTNMPQVEQMVTSGNVEGAHPLVGCDNFVDNSNSWNVGDWTGKYTQGTETIKGGSLTIEATSKDGGYYYDRPSTIDQLKDITVVVAASFLSGPATTMLGIIYRDNGSDYYLFEVSRTTYELSLYQNGKWTHLIDAQPLPSGVDFSTQPAWIVVDVVGNVQTFYINNESVNMLTDNSLTSGTVSLVIDMAASPDLKKSKVEFSHFLVRGD